MQKYVKGKKGKLLTGFFIMHMEQNNRLLANHYIRILSEYQVNIATNDLKDFL